MFTIHLNDLGFFAHHGLNDEEAITGTNFIIDVTVSFLPAGKIVSIHQTINYVSVYELIKERMAKPAALLEMLAGEIMNDISAMDNRICDITISIKKLQPPISNFTGSVGISYSKAFPQ